MILKAWNGTLNRFKPMIWHSLAKRRVYHYKWGMSEFPHKALNAVQQIESFRTAY